MGETEEKGVSGYSREDVLLQGGWRFGKSLAMSRRSV